MTERPVQSGQTRQVLLRGAKWDLERVEFIGGSGGVVRREVIRHPGAVVILPISDDGKVIFIRNHRCSVDQKLLELPAGTLEPSEPPEECAKRELHEEAGCLAATWTFLGRFYTSPGLSDELMWAYAAKDLEFVGQNLEPDERLTVHPVPVGEAMEMIDTRELVDAKSMLTLLLAARQGLL